MLKIIKIKTKQNKSVIKKIWCVEGTTGYQVCVDPPTEKKQLKKIVVIERKEVIKNLKKLNNLRNDDNRYKFLFTYQHSALLMHYNANPLDLIVDLETYPYLQEICGYEPRFLVDLLEKKHVNQVKFWGENSIQENRYNLNII
ncbi:MAG: hypothetical protein ACTTGJ_02930 [Clostridium sp.]